MGYANTSSGWLRIDLFASSRRCAAGTTFVTRSLGWSRRHDSEGRISLHAVESPEYARLRSDPALNQLRARRSRRLRAEAVPLTDRLADDSTGAGDGHPMVPSGP